jgi:hypothetical protein
MGFCDVLTIVFVILKLTNVIDWSWFWVLSPLIFVYGFIFGLFFIKGALDELNK